MMNFFSNVRDNLKDPKKKAITQLVLYGIFFLIVFILIGSSNTTNSISTINNTISTNTSISNSAIKSYNYQIIVNDNINISGEYIDGISLFNYNNTNYYLEEDLVYMIDNNNYYYYLTNIEYKIDKLLNIYNLLSNLEEESTTTYKDGSILKSYNISGSDYNTYYYNDNILNDSIITIESLSINDTLSSIKIIYNNYSDIQNITINYTNINTIDSINFNKDNYIYGGTL